MHNIAAATFPAADYRCASAFSPPTTHPLRLDNAAAVSRAVLHLAGRGRMVQPLASATEPSVFVVMAPANEKQHRPGHARKFECRFD